MRDNETEGANAFISDDSDSLFFTVEELGCDEIEFVLVIGNEEERGITEADENDGIELTKELEPLVKLCDEDVSVCDFIDKLSVIPVTTVLSPVNVPGVIAETD